MAYKRFRMLWNTRHFDVASISSTGAMTGYPESRIQDQLRSVKCRLNSTNYPYFDIDFGASIPLNAIAIIDHNLTATGVIYVLASDSPGGSDLLNLQVNAWQEVMGAGEGPADLVYPDGSLIEGDRTFLIPRPIRVIYLNEEATLADYTEVVTARYWRIMFYDAANIEGYVEIGRIIPTIYNDFGRNFSEVYLTAVDDSNVNVTIGGQEYSNAKDVYYQARLTFNNIPYADAYWFLALACQKLGRSKNCVIDVFPATDFPSQRQFYTLYGKFAELPEIGTSIEHAYFNRTMTRSAELNFKESL